MTLAWTAARDEADLALEPWRGEAGRTPGGVVVLFDRHGVRAEVAAGLASLAHGIPFDGATPSRYASITKHVFCAFALRHGLDPAAELGTLLPGLPPAFAAIPAFRALSMTGALPDLLQTYTLCGLPYSALVDLAVLDEFCDRLDALNGVPGTEIVYSNTGYRLVERALAARGHAFRPWVEDAVGDALGIRLRFPAGWDRPLDGLADGYWRDGTQASWRTGFYGPGLSASGALAGSARDLTLWLAALMRGDGPAGDVLATLAAPARLADGRPTGYGLGLLRSKLGDVGLVGHGGSLPGFKNEILLDAARGAGVVVLSNREDTDAQALAERVMAALLGQPQPRVPAATDGLPDGIFVEQDGPAWIELAGTTLTFLGTNTTLEAGTQPGEAVSASAYMPVHLRREGDAIAGEIGHAARRFLPVRQDAALGEGFAGTWRCARHNATLVIETPPGGANATLGLGPLARAVPLQPLDGRRALMAVGAPPWPSRACLWLQEPGRLRLATHHSRMLEFHRIAG